MKQGAVIDIVRLCSAIKQDAQQIYANLAQYADGTELKYFWSQMAAEEGREIERWSQIIRQADEGLIPNLFDAPERTLEELETIRADLVELEQSSAHGLDVKEAFIQACQLELHLLNPAIELLNQFSLKISKDAPANADYESHLARFVEAFKRYDVDNPELKLLGGTIQRLWQQNRQLAILSNTDGLTGVANRRGLFFSLRTLAHLAQRNGSQVGLMMIDIDHFKQVNDRYGHQRGDEVLQRIAGLIKERIRLSDLLGRYGGEEFLAFLSPVDEGGMQKLAEEIRQRVEQAFRGDMEITISIGAVHGGLNGSDVNDQIDEMIKIADTRLYTAKAGGRNQVVMQS